MLTVIMILAILSLILVVAHAVAPARVPLWVGVVLICVIELIRGIPIGR